MKTQDITDTTIESVKNARHRLQFQSIEFYIKARPMRNRDADLNEITTKTANQAFPNKCQKRKPRHWSITWTESGFGSDGVRGSALFLMHAGAWAPSTFIASSAWVPMGSDAPKRTQIRGLFLLNFTSCRAEPWACICLSSESPQMGDLEFCTKNNHDQRQKETNSGSDRERDGEERERV